jgi:hypothetical protein
MNTITVKVINFYQSTIIKLLSYIEAQL